MSDNLAAPQDPTPASDEQPIEIEHIPDGEPEAPPEQPAPPAPPAQPPQPVPPVPQPPKPPVIAQPGEQPPAEEDDSKYGEEVQKRIQQLRYLGHSERRAKEAVVRERDAAVTRANELDQE